MLYKSSKVDFFSIIENLDGNSFEYMHLSVLGAQDILPNNWSIAVTDRIDASGYDQITSFEMTVVNN